jgi:hypothetical protein
MAAVLLVDGFMASKSILWIQSLPAAMAFGAVCL